MQDVRITRRKLGVYITASEPCFFVFAPWCDGVKWALPSSRVIAVSRVTSRVLYDGSGYDEG